MYMVVGCPNCKQLQLTKAHTNFKCKYCEKSIETSKLTIRYSSNRHDGALDALYRLKEEIRS